MPTYTVRYANIALDASQQQIIATLITDAHQANTGAPGYFAQVIFDAISTGTHFIGGKPNTVPHLYVHGLIRAGRTREQKHGLMQQIAASVHAAAGIGAEDIWVYVQEIAPEQMVEFGRFLPEPGQETEWRGGFSPDKIAAFKRAGVSMS